MFKAFTHVPPGSQKGAEQPRKIRMAADLKSNTTGNSIREGMMHMSGGAVSLLRNPPSHDPSHSLDDGEALESLGVFSLLFRWLDRRLDPPP